MPPRRARWDRIEALVGRALDHPADTRPAFLTRELRDGDPSLRAEVETLVAHATTSPDFLDRVATELVPPVLSAALAEFEAGPPRPEEEDGWATPGVLLADRYRIDARAGGGGMGVVYRATDTRLDRVVALKVLPPRSHADPEARRRFVQEARAASALDHPNIGTVYDILETPDGRDCIAMAHYEGRTLRDRLAGGALELSVALDVVLQVARGLEAAHRQGIVHCDVKPENVLVTPEGVVKLVDFGLARFMETSRAGSEERRGTLPYMAPEQLRAEGVSPRTDVWALGVSLYETVTGHRPFDGPDGGAVARAILAGNAPPPSSHEPGLPDWLDDLVGRALRKNPDLRPADAGQMRAALEERRRAPEAAGHSADDGGAGTSRTWTHLAAVAATLALAAIVATPVLDGGSEPARFSRPRQLSAAQGVEDFAVWSPAADAILYQGTRGGEVFGGRPDVLIRFLDEEVPSVLTPDHDGFDGRPSWAPDGARLAFYSARGGGGYYIRAVDGGPLRRVWEGRPLGGAHNVAAWSPDGTEVAITVDGVATGSTLEIRSVADGSLRRSLPLPGRPGNLLFGTTWSPDGRFIALADAMNLTPDEARLWVVRLADGEAMPVTAGRDLAWSPAWGADSRTLYYVSDRGGGRDLWAQPMDPTGHPRGEAREVTTGIGMRNAALSRDGSRLVYSQGRTVAHVWKVPIPDEGTSSWADAEQVTSDRAYVEFVEVDPRGGQVLVSSDRAGGQDVWRFDPGGEIPTRVTTDAASDWAPMLSPDGSRLAYYSARSGNRELWVRTLADGSDLRVTDHDAIDFVPSWAPDGESLVFSSGRSGNLDVWTVDLDGSPPRALTHDPAMDAWPHWSPDGRTVVFRSNRDGTWRLWRVSADGGTPEPVTEVPTTYFRWAPDGSALYLVSGTQLWRHDLATGSERPLTALEDRQGTLGVVALAVDETHLYFTWEEDIGDLWMMERAR